MTPAASGAPEAGPDGTDQGTRPGQGAVDAAARPGQPRPGQPRPGQPRPGQPRPGQPRGWRRRDGEPAWGLVASALLFRVLWRVRVHDGHLVPARGPVLLASNHVGFLDGPMLVAVAPRFTICLVKQELFGGVLGAVIRAARQIPVDRTHGDRTALGRALEVLAAGGAVGVFPEGTRGRGDVGEVRAGAAWLALRSGAPVVPVACLGTRRTGESAGHLPRFGRRLDVVFGAPLDLTPRPGVPGRVALAQASAVLRDTMAAHVERAVARTGQRLPDDEPERGEQQ